MQFVFGADWPGVSRRSGGLSPEAHTLSKLGLGLRELYRDLIQEPIPEFLTVFIRELEESEQRSNR